LVLKNWPGVEYPYNAMTAIQGYADMEYPMMINDTVFLMIFRMPDYSRS
jgi:hypothetical protein